METHFADSLFLIALTRLTVFSAHIAPKTPKQVATFFNDNGAAIRGVVMFANVIGAVLVPLFATVAAGWI